MESSETNGLDAELFHQKLREARISIRNDVTSGVFNELKCHLTVLRKETRIMENKIVEHFRKLYPHDEFDVMYHGADIRQVVKDDADTIRGTIFYEFKKRFSTEVIDRMRKGRETSSGKIILVLACEESETIRIVKGVTVCGLESLVEVSQAFRMMLLQKKD